MKTAFLAALICLSLVSTALAQSVATTTPFTYTITMTVTPTIQSILPANTSATTPAANAGTVLAPLVCVTNPSGGTCHGPVTLGGADASKFSLTNGGVFPTSLAVGPANVASGTYNLTATASQ